MASDFLINLVNQYGYIGVFLISLISNGTFFFPVPYLLVIYYIGTIKIMDPILVAILSGLGATIGELTLYFLSMLGRIILPSNYKERARLHEDYPR
jgi:membrane protein DedA with SNARE-associated domain